MSKLIVFGAGDVASLAHYYFNNDSEHDVECFVVDKEFLGSKNEFEGKPLIAFENVPELYPPAIYQMFIAISYTGMNSVREQKYNIAKAKGYQLVSYVSSRCIYLSENQPGDNCFILEGNTIQPYVRIGNNVTLWSGNHIGHHSVIDEHNFISSHVVISGHCHVKPNCFLGVNSSVAHGVTIARATLIGAGAVVTSDTEERGVYVPSRSVKLEKESADFKF